MSNETKTLLGDSRLRSAYAQMLAKSCFPQVAEILPKIDQLLEDSIKVTDFSLQKGSVSCRVVAPDGNNVGVRLYAEPLNDEQWRQLTELLSEKSYFAAQLLAGKLPVEVVELAESNSIPMIPKESLAIDQDTETLVEPTLEAAVLLMRVSDVLEADPCQFLLFRGTTPQELLAELRKKRLTQTAERRRPTAITELAYPSAETNTADIASFWNMSSQVKDLNYTIKADELPASILKWLAPMPLNGLEDDIDFIVEEGYARVARLAQSFGLGL